MVVRKFILRHAGEQFTIDYDTSDGLDVLKFQIFSLTDVPPDDQNILVEDGEVLITESSDLSSVSEKLRLVSINEKGEGSVTGGGENEGSKSSGMSDEELARMLQAEEDLIAFQMHKAADTAGTRQFEERIRSMVSQVLMYEDPVRQEAARKTVPFDRIEEKALVSLAREGNFNPSKAEKDHALLLQLLFWFKGSFRWVNSPPCDNCGSETTSCGMGTPVASERQFGASRVEIYRCNNNCSRTTRFPRYNDPLMLLETRKGRCGEWANCFTLYCRAFGYDSRLKDETIDWFLLQGIPLSWNLLNLNPDRSLLSKALIHLKDHLWTECFSEFHGRWMHLDPCEGVYDNPLLYEKGWNKKLSYVIAISRGGVRDVTKRYTRKWHEVLPRRGMISENAASAILSNITSECRKGYTSQTIHNLELQDQKEADELGSVYLVDDSSLSLPGRQSGSEEWCMARHEVGSAENNSWSYSDCPIRICYDNHVHDIHSSLTCLLSHFAEDNFSKPEVIENLEILRRLLVDLKSRPFKVRRISLNISSTGSKLFKEASPSLDEFFSSLSVKREYGSYGNISIYLAGNPVLTSIALPVALHTLDEITRDIGTVDHFDQTLVNNYSRLNRISCGSVQASGEQLPYGIATAALDGCRLSKWEEPNGAKGCWLIYRVKDGHLCLLDCYDLMSANDAPERDPMDWVLDGSEDGGINWHILDQQSSHTFENRFRRKRFKVSSSRKSNTFRFRFLKVRDPDTQSRFQIGSIDLYANDDGPCSSILHPKMKGLAI